jgi:uncharacterized repeat protein (TIGR01451 family)
MNGRILPPALLCSLLLLLASPAHSAGAARSEALPASSQPSFASTCGFGWGRFPTQRAGDDLFGLARLGANEPWAVGTDKSSDGLALRFDGTSWISIPTIPVSNSDTFRSVAAVGSDDIWSVGYTSGTARTLAEHWDGTQFSVVPTPNLGSGNNYLYDAVAVAPDDVWAVGEASQSLILHWDGSAWSISPTPTTVRLSSVAATSSTDVWAVGDPQSGTNIPAILHWNGSWWTSVASPMKAWLFGVTALSPTDVWTAGQTFDLPRKPVIEHWNGSAWTVTTLPTQSKGSLEAVAASSPSDVWSVGDATRGSTSVAFHWDGTAWTDFQSSGGLNDLFVVARDEAWSAGTTDRNKDADNVDRFCPLDVADSGIGRGYIRRAQGVSATWLFDPANTTEHSVMDASGLGLFDSGLEPPGALFAYRFTAAGTYHYTDVATGFSAQVAVPVSVFPTEGTTSDSFKITWALTAPPPSLVHDVQVEPPGQAWTDLLTGTTENTLNYTPGDGGGIYRFRARMRDPATSAGIGYSPPASIFVTALQADVGISGTDAPDPVAMGTHLTYYLLVVDNGPDEAGNVAVTDPLPSTVTFVSATSTAGSCTGGQTVICSLGKMSNGITELVTIVVTPNQPGTLEDTATVTTSSDDSNTANDSTTVETTVTP